MDFSNRRVLYISYNGMLEPLGQSQVIPYLKELHRRTRLNFTLLSFEQPHAYTATGVVKSAALKNELSGNGIDWHWLPYHKTPSLPATAYDVVAGIRYATRLMRHSPVDLVHARSHIPATIALGLKRRFGTKMIFDVRGLMADEYVDANHWRENSIPYRLTKSMERRALEAADGIVTLTERIWPIMKAWPALSNRQIAHRVVPCCADLDRFDFSAEDRNRRRQELKLENRLVVIYSGSIDGWYLTECMADFFGCLRKARTDAFFLWLTPSRHDRIESLMQARGINRNDYGVLSATVAEMPSYLAAGDVGLAFIKPCFSKLASSPTKYAEYLGCGLPLVINAGVGDSDVLGAEAQVGALVHDFSEAGYLQAWKVVEDLLAEPMIRRKTREVAERYFDLINVGVDRYASLYAELMNG
jgi:glycosyltransferase involved in cell wall biosynthesis